MTSNNLCTVKNSYDLMDKHKYLSPANYNIVSLDIKSVFTNVPIQGALDCLEKGLHEFLYSSVEIEEILNLVNQ